MGFNEWPVAGGSRFQFWPFFPVDRQSRQIGCVIRPGGALQFVGGDVVAQALGQLGQFMRHLCCFLGAATVLFAGLGDPFNAPGNLVAGLALFLQG